MSLVFKPETLRGIVDIPALFDFGHSSTPYNSFKVDCFGSRPTGGTYRKKIDCMRWVCKIKPSEWVYTRCHWPNRRLFADSLVNGWAFDFYHSDIVPFVSMCFPPTLMSRLNNHSLCTPCLYMNLS